jgi:hypothetical protein
MHDKTVCECVCRHVAVRGRIESGSYWNFSATLNEKTSLLFIDSVGLTQIFPFLLFPRRLLLCLKWQQQLSSGK